MMAKRDVVVECRARKKSPCYSKRFFLSSFVFVLLASALLPLYTVFADSSTLETYTKARYLMNGVNGCFQNVIQTKVIGRSTTKSTNFSSGSTISRADGKNGDWFVDANDNNTQGNGFASYLIYGTQQTSCNAIMSNLASISGYSQFSDFASSVRDNDDNKNYFNSNDSEDSINQLKDQVLSLVKTKVFGGDDQYQNYINNSSQAGDYLMYTAAFFSSDGCGAQQADDAQDADDGYTGVTTFNHSNDDMKDVKNYLGSSAAGSHKNTSKIVAYSNDDGVGQAITCADIASGINNTIDAFISYYNDHKDQQVNLDNSASNFRTGQSGGTQDTSDACGKSVSGLGWIVCPVINGLQNFNDGVWSVISQMLTVNPLESGSGSSIYNAWVVVRNLANIVFIIAFLVVIISQITGFGISNYGIKSMLPKLIIGIIAINLSFLIMQVLVDVFNIIGSSLYGVIMHAAPKVSTTNTGTLISLLGLAAAGGTGIVVGAVTIGIGTAFWMILPGLLGIAISLFAGFITLVVRQAAIPILAIIAPFALLAYMLPNTKPWFDKWKKLLTDMLMLYPLAALVFAGAQFAGQTIIGNTGDFWNTLIGLLVTMLPLFSLPFIATKGGDIATAIMNNGKKLGGMASKGLSDNFTGDMAKSAQAQSEARALAGSRGGLFGIRRGLARGQLRRKAIVTSREAEANKAGIEYIANETKTNPKLAQQMAAGGGTDAMNRVMARAVQASDKLDDEATQNAELLIRSNSNAVNMIKDASKALSDAVMAGDSTTAKAATNILLNSGGKGLETLSSTIGSLEKEPNIDTSAEGTPLMSIRNKVVKAGIKGKHAYLDKWSTGKVGMIAVTGDPSATNGLNAVELAGQSPDVLRQATRIGGVTLEQVSSVRSNSAAQALLNDEKRGILGI